MDGETLAEKGTIFSSIGALEVQMSVGLFVSPHFVFKLRQGASITRFVGLSVCQKNLKQL